MSRATQLFKPGVAMAPSQQQPHIAGGSAERSTPVLAKVALGGGAMFIASGVGNGLNYLFSIGLARVLGPVEFGLYAIGVTFFNILSQIAPLGTATGVIKFVSESLARKESSYAYETVKLAIKTTLVSSLLIAVTLAVGAMPIAHFLYGAPELKPILILFAIAIPFAASTTVLVNALQALQAIAPTILIKYVWEPIGKIALVGGTFLLGYHVLGAVAAIGVVMAVGSYFAIRALRTASLSAGATTEGANAFRFREFVAFCSPVAVSNVVGVLAPRSDILILGYWVSVQEIGVYLACVQTAGIISLVLGAFETAFAPFVARVLALNDGQQLKAVYQSLSRVVVLFTVPLCILLNMLADPILGLFGEAFRPGWIPLAILTTGHLVSSMASSPNHILLMGGHSTTVMLNTLVIGLLQILVSFLLVPYFGMVGAALASSGALLTITLVRVFQVWRRYQVFPFSRLLVKPIMGGFIMMSTIFVAKHCLDVDSIGLTAMIVAALGVTAYLGCQLLLGLEPSERAFLKDLTHRIFPRTSGGANRESRFLGH